MDRTVGHGNLPRSAAALIGRERELSSVAARLRTHQVVTGSGVGGVGKTRLALQAAVDAQAEFPGGAWLAELARTGLVP